MSVILTKMLFKIKQNISFKDEINTEISKSTVGWQLDHAIKVFNAVIEQAINSNPEDYKTSFNFKRSVLFRLGFLPRGKARAPKAVLPPETILEANIEAQLQKAYANLKKIELLPETAFFNHHIFGVLNKKQTLRFIEIHTNHHLKIIRDILDK